MSASEPEADRRPLIGVAGWLETASWSIVTSPAALVEQAFVEMLSEVGADTVILPVQPHVPVHLVRELDGLILAGGHDVHAERFGGSAAEALPPEAALRDSHELELARVAIDEGVPVLGVCRGCQVLNVLGGGTLIAEVKESYEGIVHGYLAKDEPFKWSQHEVEADPGTPVGEALGESFEVMSSHHQAVDRVAPGWEVAARSSDGLVEAIYDPQHPFVVGVQWHPEAGTDATIFAALAAAGRRRREARDSEPAAPHGG